MPLLKYEHPVLVSDVSKHTKKILPPLASSKETSTQSVTTQSPKLQPRRPSLQQPSPLGSHVEHPNSGQTEHNRGGDETIDSILPPKEWEDETGVWIQKVSNTPATRLDVVALQEHLDNFLLKRQARETGICEIRRELYDQTFDELIRQVAISCQERGLLLLRVRDELRMTIDSYKSLYESGTAFGMRKTLSNEDRQLKLEAENKSLLSELQKLKLQNSQLKQDLEESDKKNLERRALDEKKSSEEAMQLKKLNALLKTQLESVMMAAAASAKK